MGTEQRNRRAGYPEAADVERYARRGDGGRNQDQRSVLTRIRRLSLTVLCCSLTGAVSNGAAALTSQGGTLNVDAGAKLLIDNITQGEYAITSGFSVSNVQGWNGDNLSTPDNLIGLVLGKDADGSMKVQATARRSSDVFQGLSLVNTMDAIWGKG